MNYAGFVEVADCAAAADGGSLWLSLRGPDGEAGFVLVRSLATRGTPDYDRIRGSGGAMLAPDEVRRLCVRLRELAATLPPCCGLVEAFAAAEAQAARPYD
jgi:hypothetical protein